MNDKYNLTSGPILAELIKVSLPVMATSFVQMAYNMIDLMWLGKLSTAAVSSAGFGGFFIWLGAAVFLLVKIGTEVRVSQSIGRGDYNTAKSYAKNGVQIEFIFALIYSLVLFFLAKELIEFFSIKEINVYNDAIVYLRFISFGMIFYLLNPVFSASLNGTGNTFTPFIISTIGLVVNILLDPLFIFEFGLGIRGAAIATVISQFIVFIIFILYSKYKDNILSKANYLSKIDINKVKDILRLGIPVAIQSALFTFIAMVISRLVAQYGTDANAVQKVGSQIEALSWLTAGGIQTALSAFVGQNYGAKKFDRVLRGVKYALLSMTIYGIVISVFMFYCANFLYSIFLHNENAILLGVDYLRILAFSQLFMIIEAMVSGAFNGLGKTSYPSIVSITFNLLRIVMAIYLSNIYGLNGIWFAITISSILKGTILYLWFKLYIDKDKRFN